jgi:hypothetical protein
MIFVRSLLFVVTTLAAGKRVPSDGNVTAHAHGAPAAENASSSCPAPNNNATLTTNEDVCASTDPLILPEHAILPLLLPCAALLFTHMPTLLLASRARVRDLKGATAQAVLTWLSVCSVAWAYASGRRAFAYAASLHTSVYLLSKPSSPTVVVGPIADLFARETCITVILLCAWQLGPPLPVADAPGHPAASACCGLASHLAGFMIPDLVGPIAEGLARRLVAGGG